MALHKSMPRIVQWSILDLAEAVKQSGYTSANIQIVDGEPGHTSLFDADGNQEFYWYDDGDFFLHPDEGVDE